MTRRLVLWCAVALAFALGYGCRRGPTEPKPCNVTTAHTIDTIGWVYRDTRGFDTVGPILAMYCGPVRPQR